MLPPEALSPESLTFWIRVGTAVLCGGVIGIERQSRGKVAGVRTSILITLGTTVFVTLGASFDPERSDPARVLGQVVTGIGFLGAGVILAREGRILGVTTASVIWVLAGLGSLIALGHLGAAVALTILTLVILVGVEKGETAWERRQGHRVSRELEGIEVE
jgi:putative Mg2+ transporter-C (MgtC) family protein